MRYFCLHIQDATKHLPGLPSHFPSQMLCWQPRSGPCLWVSSVPISCLDLSQGIFRWFSHKLQTKVRLVFDGESRNGFSILTIGGHLDARCFIPQPSLTSLCIFQLALKSAFKLTHRFWPSLYRVLNYTRDLWHLLAPGTMWAEHPQQIFGCDDKETAKE